MTEMAGEEAEALFVTKRDLKELRKNRFLHNVAFAAISGIAAVSAFLIGDAIIANEQSGGYPFVALMATAVIPRKRKFLTWHRSLAMVLVTAFSFLLGASSPDSTFGVGTYYGTYAQPL
jgi:hypothetical protein